MSNNTSKMIGVLSCCLIPVVIGFVFLIGGFMLFAVLAVTSPPLANIESDEGEPEKEELVEVADESEPKSLKELLKDVTGVESVDDSGEELIVKIQGRDNFTNNAIKRSMLRSAFECMSILKDSDNEFSSVVFDAYFPLIDQLGNTSNQRVMLLSFRRPTVSKINLEKLIPDDLIGAADEHWLHPAMK